MYIKQLAAAGKVTLGRVDNCVDGRMIDEATSFRDFGAAKALLLYRKLKIGDLRREAREAREGRGDEKVVPRPCHSGTPPEAEMTRLIHRLGLIPRAVTLKHLLQSG